MNPALVEKYEEFSVRHPGSKQRGPAQDQVFTYTAGPAAQDAMAKVVQVSGCSYPVGLEALATEWIAELPSDRQASLISALRADDDVTETALVDAVAFSYIVTTGHGVSVTYVFVGDIWLVLFNVVTASDVMNDAMLQDLLQPIQDLNPSRDLYTAA